MTTDTNTAQANTASDAPAARNVMMVIIITPLRCSAAYCSPIPAVRAAGGSSSGW